MKEESATFGASVRLKPRDGRPETEDFRLKTDKTDPRNRQMHWAYGAIIDELLAFEQRKTPTNALQSRVEGKND